MIQKIITLPIFMFTRVALSALISAIAGIMMISFLWMLWSFIDDVYNHLLFPEEEVAVEETSIDEFPHIQPITVTAQKRPIKGKNDDD